MRTALAAERPSPQRSQKSGIMCFQNVGNWLDCTNCLGLEKLPVVEEAKQERKLTPSRSRKVGSLLMAENEQEAKEKVKVEKSKAAWKRISRKASAGGGGLEQRSSAGFRKAADALIRAARKRENLQEEGKVVPMLRRDAPRSDEEDNPPTNMQAEVMAAGFASPSLSMWGGEEEVAPAQTKPAGLSGNLFSSRGGGIFASNSSSSYMSSNSMPTLSEGTEPEARKTQPNLQLAIDNLPNLAPLTFLTSADDDNSSELRSPIRSPIRSPMRSPFRSPRREAGSPFLSDNPSWSVPVSRNSVDSPRLSQSQALLAKLGGPGSLASTHGLITSRSMPLSQPKSPRAMGLTRPKSPRAASKSPTREDGPSFKDLKEDAYSILMQQNQSRLKKERQRRSSVEGSILPSPNQSPTRG